jgi:hypothetical protein
VRLSHRRRTPGFFGCRASGLDARAVPTRTDGALGLALRRVPRRALPLSDRLTVGGRTLCLSMPGIAVGRETETTLALAAALGTPPTTMAATRSPLEAECVTWSTSHRRGNRPRAYLAQRHAVAVFQREERRPIEPNPPHNSASLLAGVRVVCATASTR